MPKWSNASALSSVQAWVVISYPPPDSSTSVPSRRSTAPVIRPLRVAFRRLRRIAAPPEAANIETIVNTLVTVRHSCRDRRLKWVGRVAARRLQESLQPEETASRKITVPHLVLPLYVVQSWTSEIISLKTSHIGCVLETNSSNVNRKINIKTILFYASFKLI
jgi:hypothetical protein